MFWFCETGWTIVVLNSSCPRSCIIESHLVGVFLPFFMSLVETYLCICNIRAVALWRKLRLTLLLAVWDLAWYIIECIITLWVVKFPLGSICNWFVYLIELRVICIPATSIVDSDFVVQRERIVFQNNVSSIPFLDFLPSFTIFGILYFCVYEI